MQLTPLTLKAAGLFVAKHHRHNRPPQGGLFAVGLEHDGALIAVAIIGRPIAMHMSDGKTCEVTRLCSDGTRNACSMLYGAAVRAARALGYHRIITYTLASEPGTSLKASGWKQDAEVKGGQTWSRPSRNRVQVDLFGEQQRPTEDKIRWVQYLTTHSVLPPR
jgi:hypothetical protein